LPVQPYYNLMASIAANNPVFASLIAISFLFWNLPAMFPNTFMPVRTIFAWSFDRILPSKLSEVNERTHAPIAAIITASAIVLAIDVMIGLAYIVLSYPQLGISAPWQGFAFMGGLIVIGLLIYYIARFSQASKGINLDLIYQELPPE